MMKVEISSADPALTNQRRARMVSEYQLGRVLQRASRQAERGGYLGCVVLARVVPPPSLQNEVEGQQRQMEEAASALASLGRESNFFSRLSCRPDEFGFLVKHLGVRTDGRLFCERVEAFELSQGYRLRTGIALYPLQGLRCHMLWMIARQDLEMNQGEVELSSHHIPNDTLPVKRRA
ncbi:MAG: hypothetical protein MK135_04475 [Polyangiaceae bacterium]|nr:hypothetical protein [Polyangiaceae bacterium]